MPSCGPNSTWPIGKDVAPPRSHLVELRVRDLGVIDDVTVSLAPGMTALTGETGAGKTLLVEAIGLLLGGRADPSLVRAGADEALVEGRFRRSDRGVGGVAGARDGQVGVDHRNDGADDGADDGDEILLARSVVRGGRSKAWIDGRMASIAALSEVAAGLVELHGQHQHRSLIHADTQRAALDAFGQIELGPLESARLTMRRLEGESSLLGGDARQRAREVDLLTYQLDEIAAAAIEDTDEDRRLEEEEDRLAAAASHRQAAATALDSLTGEGDASALERLAQASRSLAGRAPLAPMETRLRTAMADLSDLSTELRAVVETWEDDPERLEEIRTRRQLLHQLERKYGEGLGEVLAFAAGARAQLEAIEAQERRAVELDGEIAAARADLEAAEATVAAARRTAAPRMAGQIQTALRELAMPSARFSVAVEGPGPADQVTFLLGANAGEPPQPLAKAASGGELARTMLAIRLATTDTQGVMLFDEVDAGVGGAAAVAVGSSLSELSRHAQVLVVTHLAQVASQADHQIRVQKSERSRRTRTEVAMLDTDGRVIELSRMLSGSPASQSARRHARELLGRRVDPATSGPATPGAGSARRTGSFR
jgi:DNA repair protein RecN (Recombination protein N)